MDAESLARTWLCLGIGERDREQRPDGPRQRPGGDREQQCLLGAGQRGEGADPDQEVERQGGPAVGPVGVVAHHPQAVLRRTSTEAIGTVGQPVQVLNTVSKKILSGTALPNGGVEMTSTLNVAGL